MSPNSVPNIKSEFKVTFLAFCASVWHIEKQNFTCCNKSSWGWNVVTVINNFLEKLNKKFSKKKNGEFKFSCLYSLTFKTMANLLLEVQKTAKDCIMLVVKSNCISICQIKYTSFHIMHIMWFSRSPWAKQFLTLLPFNSHASLSFTTSFLPFG